MNAGKAAGDLDVDHRILPQPQRMVVQSVIEKFPPIEFAPEGHPDRMAKRRLEELEPFHILRPGFTVDRLVGLADPLEITAYDIVPAILPDRGGHLLQHARLPKIVAVEESTYS